MFPRARAHDRLSPTLIIQQTYLKGEHFLRSQTLLKYNTGPRVVICYKYNSGIRGATSRSEALATLKIQFYYEKLPFLINIF